jgi:hypothetical protein
MAKHFLYLTNDKLTALLWKDGKIAGKEVFLARDYHSTDFERYIAARHATPAYLLLDITEEDFRLDTIPHLRGADQEAVIARKLGQAFRNAAYRHAQVQDRESEGRRDDRVLYHAISGADMVKSWVQALEKFSVVLEGVYSAPVLSAQLLKKLDMGAQHTLLVSLVADHNLRQTYLQNQHVKFSRLTPLDGESELSFGQQIADETSRTWQYLDSLRYFASGDKLEACILIHPNDRKPVSDAIRNYPLFQYRILDTDEVAAKLKLKPPPPTSHAEEIFAHLFAGIPLDNHFATRDQTRPARMRKAGIGLHALTAAVLAGGIAWSGYNLFLAANIGSDIQTRAQQTSAITLRYRSITGAVQETRVSSDTSRDAAALYKSYLHPASTPAGLVRDVSQVLARFPEIKLSQLAWLPSEDAKSNPEITLVSSKGNPPIKSDPAAQDKTAPVQGAAPAAARNAPLAGNRYQILVIDAALATGATDLRATLEYIDKFVAELNAIPGWQVSTFASPLDVRPGSTIKANFSGQTAAPFEARFAVRIVRNNAETPS